MVHIGLSFQLCPTLQTFSTGLQASYRDVRVVGVTCGLVLPEIIIGNVPSSVAGDSCYNYAVWRAHRFREKPIRVVMNHQ